VGRDGLGRGRPRRRRAAGAERNLVWFESLDETHERYRTRYLPAQRRYRPHERATFVFRNIELTEPELVANRS
jgi:hypothetical protein